MDNGKIHVSLDITWGKASSDVGPGLVRRQILKEAKGEADGYWKWWSEPGCWRKWDDSQILEELKRARMLGEVKWALHIGRIKLESENGKVRWARVLEGVKWESGIGRGKECGILEVLFWEWQVTTDLEMEHGSCLFNSAACSTFCLFPCLCHQIGLTHPSDYIIPAGTIYAQLPVNKLWGVFLLYQLIR